MQPRDDTLMLTLMTHQRDRFWSYLYVVSEQYACFSRTERKCGLCSELQHNL